MMDTVTYRKYRYVVGLRIGEKRFWTRDLDEMKRCVHTITRFFERHVRQLGHVPTDMHKADIFVSAQPELGLSGQNPRSTRDKKVLYMIGWVYADVAEEDRKHLENWLSPHEYVVLAKGKLPSWRSG